MAQKENPREKKITKTFRNGKAVFQQDFTIRIENTPSEDKFNVVEQRVGFKDAKIVFHGDKAKAEKFFAEQGSVTLTNTNPASPTQVIQRA